MRSLLAAIAFYTVIPLPKKLSLNFERVARWLPVVGLGLGGILAGVDALLGWVVAPAMRSLLVLCFWLGITGGLHLDGAMDTADGLAAGDRTVRGTERRLEAMSDSYTGAFGVMVAIVLLLLKFVSVMHLPQPRWIWLLLTPMWGRWAQLGAIAFYPYLKPQGKGRFLKDSTSLTEFVVPTGSVVVVCAITRLLTKQTQTPAVALWMLISAAIALGVGAWFNRQFGGHTGDTYGATVEWTEAIVLVIATL